jgi:hypothetical protein
MERLPMQIQEDKPQQDALPSHKCLVFLTLSSLFIACAALVLAAYVVVLARSNEKDIAAQTEKSQSYASASALAALQNTTAVLNATTDSRFSKVYRISQDSYIPDVQGQLSFTANQTWEITAPTVVFDGPVLVEFFMRFYAWRASVASPETKMEVSVSIDPAAFVYQDLFILPVPATGSYISPPQYFSRQTLLWFRLVCPASCGATGFAFSYRVTRVQPTTYQLL